MPAAALALPASCFDDPAQQGQVTLADGYYKFDLNFSDPACPSGGDYLHRSDARRRTGYVAGYSQIIPPTSDASTAAVLRAGLPGQRRRRDPGDGAALRSAALRVRAGGLGAGAHAPARPTTCT